MGNKAKALFMDSDFTAELKSVNVDGGSIVIDRKYEHIVDKTTPLILKTGLLSNTPLYICKWDSLTPIKFKKVTKVVTKEEANKMIKEDENWVRIEKIEEMNKSRHGRGLLRQKISNWRRRRKYKNNPYIINRPEPKYKIINTLEPTHFEYRKLEPVELKFYKSDIPPTLMKETFDMRFLKNMKTYSAGKGGSGEGIDKTKVILIAIGSMIFGIVLFYLIMTSAGIGL